MKKLFVSALAMLAVALGFTACSSEDEFVKETPAQGKKVTVIATTEEPSAQRTALEQDGDKYKVVWSEDDKIKLIDASSNFTEFTLKNEYANQSTGEFTGTPLERGLTYTAYYPSTYDGTTWPAAQTYVAGNIPLGVPMKAENIEVDEDGNVPPISFKNEGGILCLNFKMDEDTKSISKVVVSSKTGLTENIELNCMTAVEVGTTSVPFNIAVPAAAYSDLKIVIFDENGNVCTKTAKEAITVEGSKITKITLTLLASKFQRFVELAGLKWATVNVGEVNGVEAKAGPAATDNEWGCYYYTQENAKDAAESWGGTWKLPTEEQWQKLLDECNWTWKKDYYFGGKTMNGCKVSDKNDPSKFIFLPAAGFNNEDDNDVNDQGCYGSYWSTDDLRYLYFDNANRLMCNLKSPYNGLTVRPVSD